MSGARWLYVPTGPEILPVPMSSTAVAQAPPAAIELERPARELEPERDRLGVDRVGATHHHRVGLSAGPGDQRGKQSIAVLQQDLARGPQLERERGVDDVALGQPEVEIAALRPDGLGDLADERDHVVVGRLLDLGDPLRSRRRACLDRGERLLRDQSARRPGRGRRRSRPGASARSGRAPSRSRPSRRACSGGSRAAPTCWIRPMSRRRCRPSQEIVSAAASARAPLAASRSGPRPTTVRIRPPSVVPRTVALARAGVEDECPVARRRRDPRSRRHVAGCRDSPRPQARSRLRPRASPGTALREALERSRAAAASSSGPSGAASRGRMTCASGSPSRALHSRRRGPSSVSIRPA